MAKSEFLVTLDLSKNLVSEVMSYVDKNYAQPLRETRAPWAKFGVNYEQLDQKVIDALAPIYEHDPTNPMCNCEICQALARGERRMEGR